MIELQPGPELIRPVVITAFEGWNDAGEAASDSIDHLRQVFGAQDLAEMEPDDYYDFQVNRPHIRIEDHRRVITWPTTRIFTASSSARDLVLVHGIEPNMRWRAFCAEIVSVVRAVNADLVVNLGALLADVPHTRPVPTTAIATDPDLIAMLDVGPTNYSGPTGIVGVLQQACEAVGLPAVSLWAAVPHYAANTPCPKATLALLRRLEDVIDTSIPMGDLASDAAEWEQGVDEMASQDSGIAEYVARLEQVQDSQVVTDGSGEAIAAAFERYLRRREG